MYGITQDGESELAVLESRAELEYGDVLTFAFLFRNKNGDLNSIFLKEQEDVIALYTILGEFLKKAEIKISGSKR